MQESKLYNLGHLGAKNDHDSLGLFQQRPSMGWGTAAQINDPVYAATAFYLALKRVPGWESMAVTVAAQRVQRLRALFLIQMQRDLAVGLCREAMAAFLEIAANALEVVELAVVDDVKPAVFVRDRLVASR